MTDKKKILYIVNVDWFFISHRLPFAVEAKRRGYEVAIATTNTGRFKELDDLGFQVFDLKVNRSGTNPYKEVLLILRIIRILKEIRPAVVHNVTLKMSIYCSIATRFVHVNKVINAISGLGFNFTADRKTISNTIIKALIRIAFYKRNFIFIFQNSDDLSLFQRQKIDVENTFCIIKGVGVDLEKFNCSERKTRSGISFIMTARILKDKGISEFITASRKVLFKYPESRFILAGDIDKENPASFTEVELRNELKGTNINWLGHRNDIIDLLQDSDVMVFPSYREGLPKSLIEAAAVGLPIITTDAIGCRDCVDECVNGYKVQIGNSELLAEKMIELIENPEMLERMGKASRVKAEKEFSLVKVIERTLKLYE